MKRSWITKGAPIVALVFLVAFGMMSCSTDPMSSPDNGSESYIGGSENVKPEMTNVDDGTIIKGYLEESETGDCWNLIVNAEEQYELILPNSGPSAETEHMYATAIGFVDDIPAVCSSYAVFRVTYIEIY